MIRETVDDIKRRWTATTIREYTFASWQKDVHALLEEIYRLQLEVRNLKRIDESAKT